MKPTITQIKDLQLADVVGLDTETYSCATVSNITKDFVHFFRPYTHTADFSYTGGVICYTGIEHFQRHIEDTCPVMLLQRKELK